MIGIFVRPDYGQPTFQTDTFHGGNALVKIWQLVGLVKVRRPSFRE
jgi:hypothetical protein